MTERQGTKGYHQMSLQERIDTTSRNFDPLGINFDRPKYPAYAEVATRITSFKDCSSSMKHNPCDFALAGFLYTGSHDYIHCFHCGGKLSDWRSVDEPWTEHARRFPTCGFLRQKKGDEFIAVVQIRHPTEVSEDNHACTSKYDIVWNHNFVFKIFLKQINENPYKILREIIILSSKSL